MSLYEKQSDVSKECICIVASLKSVWNISTFYEDACRLCNKAFIEGWRSSSYIIYIDMESLHTVEKQWKTSSHLKLNYEL